MLEPREDDNATAECENITANAWKIIIIWQSAAKITLSDVNHKSNKVHRLVERRTDINTDIYIGKRGELL